MALNVCFRGGHVILCSYDVRVFSLFLATFRNGSKQKISHCDIFELPIHTLKSYKSYKARKLYNFLYSYSWSPNFLASACISHAAFLFLRFFRPGFSQTGIQTVRFSTFFLLILETWCLGEGVRKYRREGPITSWAREERKSRTIEPRLLAWPIFVYLANS